MESKSIFPSAIIRNTPDEATVDGALLEAVNTRFKDGARRGVGKKSILPDNILGAVQQELTTYFHPQSNRYIVVVLDGSEVRIETWVSNSVQGVKDSFFISIGVQGIDALITHVGNFVYVSSAALVQTWILYWRDDNSEFVLLDDLPEIMFVPTLANETRVYCAVSTVGITDIDDRFNAALGIYLETVAYQKNDGFFFGNLSLRYAFKLFDGSIILHSGIRYLRAGVHYGLGSTNHNPRVDLSDPDLVGVGTSVPYYIDFEQLRIYLNITNQNSVLQKYYDCGIIKSVCVYSSSIIGGFFVPETRQFVDSSGNFPMDQTAFQKLSDPQSMFLLKEYELSDLLSTNVVDEIVKEIKDVELNTAMDVDNFTHLKYIPNRLLNLNQRVHLGDLIVKPPLLIDNYFNEYLTSYTDFTVPEDLFQYMGGYGLSLSNPPNNYFTVSPTASIKYYSTVFLKTDEGVKRVTSELNNVYGNADGNIILILREILIYPDARAFKIDIWAIDTGSNISKLVTTISLKGATYNNYSYNTGDILFNTFDAQRICLHPILLPATTAELLALPTFYDGLIVNQTILDKNRVQVSRLNNPLVWPAENSYRFGNERNTVLGMITAQEPITETVFGQYPVNIFTSGGIYALEQGSGSVLYSNVVELNKEILSNPKGLYGITGAIIFVTKEGLKLLQGRQVVDLSNEVRGVVNNPCKEDYYVKETITDPVICELYNYLSGPFLDYIQNAVIGFSNVFNEIYVSDKSKSYSYVYNLDTKSWHTITETWSQFLLTQGFNNGLFSDLNTEGVSQQYYIQTRPFFLENPGNKKINQLLVRSTQIITQNEYSSVILLGSNDAVNWVAIGKVLITNETRVPVMSNLAGHYRYFTLCICGKGQSFTLTSIDIGFTSRYTNKIR